MAENRTATITPELEKCARAMCAKRGGFYDELHMDERAPWDDLARACLSALLPVSNAMYEAGWSRGGISDDGASQCPLPEEAIEDAINYVLGEKL